MCFFPIQQWPCYNIIETNKGLDYFYIFSAEFLHLCLQVEQCTSSFWGHNEIYTSDTIAISQTDSTPTKIKKYAAVAELSGTRDAIRHLKTFRVISNEMPV